MLYGPKVGWLIYCDIFVSVVITCNFVKIFLWRRSAGRNRRHGKKLTSQCSRHCLKRPSCHIDLAWARIEFACQLHSSAVKQSIFQDASSAGVQGQRSWGWNLHQLRNSLINNLLNFNSWKIKSAANQTNNLTLNLLHGISPLFAESQNHKIHSLSTVWKKWEFYYHDFCVKIGKIFVKTKQMRNRLYLLSKTTL